MKRDARIGLVMILLVGLSVTLLIGKALYKRGEVVENDPDRSADAGRGTVAANEFTHTETGGTETAAQPRNENAVAEANSAVQNFVSDQNRPLNSIPNPGSTAQAGTNPTNPRGDHLTPEQMLVADHEAPPPAMAANVVRPGTPAAPEFFAYTVAAGDNMWRISSKVYGDGKYTQKIVEANAGLTATKVKPGSIIKIPTIPNKKILMTLPHFGEKATAADLPAAKIDAAHPAAPVPAPAADATKATKHKVEAGDTLAVIAKKYYGSSGPKSIARITEANKGIDPAKLHIGQELNIPAAPAVAAATTPVTK